MMNAQAAAAHVALAALLGIVLMDEMKSVLQLLLILHSLRWLPCAPQRSCSAHAFALSAHRLSGVHGHHLFE